MSTIKFKNSATSSQAPTAGNLAYGELALNTADQKIFFKNTSDAVKELVGPNMFADLPTSDPSENGRLWNDAGTLKISQETSGTQGPFYDVNNYYFESEPTDTVPVEQIVTVVWNGVTVYNALLEQDTPPSSVTASGVTYNRVASQAGFKWSVSRVV